MLMLKLMEKIPFFRQFTLEEKTVLIESESFFATFRDGEAIIQEGTTDNSFFILIKGSVAIVKGADLGHVVNTLDAGAVFGEISFLTKRPRSASVVSRGDTTVFMVDRTSIERLDLRLQNKIKDQLINVLVDHLDTMNDSLAKLTQRMV